MSNNTNKKRKRISLADNTTNDEPLAKRPKTSGFTTMKHAAAPAKNNASLKKSNLDEERKNLPIYSARSILLDAIQKHQALVVVGETGSGKTSIIIFYYFTSLLAQIPQYIFEHFEKVKVAVTQPRRVAALSISRRVAQEMNVELGQQVGYSIRFEDCSSKSTQIKYLTDGMLLRESQIDPLLKRYTHIILDEAHERTLHTDVLFGIVKQVMQKRKDLKVIIMSATLEAEAFAKFYDNAKIIYISGRQYPVDVFYAEENQADFLDAAITTTIQLHLDEPSGDILVFLTGQEEIESVEKILVDRAKLLPPEAMKLLVCPIFAALPQEKQLQVFEPAPENCRKVILATNIAETSITINGIKYVVDTGLVKQRAYDPSSGLEVLKQTSISKASARQRTGRAGREASGKCYRLYTEDAFDELEDYSLPEILRCNLATVVLQMKSMGIDDIINFDFLDKPSRAGLNKSMEELIVLGALAKAKSPTELPKLTELGKKMAQFPLDPMLSVSLLRSEEFQCVDEMLTIISMLCVEAIFYSPYEKRETANKAKMRFSSKYGDHITLLKVYREYKKANYDDKWCHQHFINARAMKKVKEVRRQLESYMNDLKIPLVSCGKELPNVCKCITAGFFMNAASKVPHARKYKTLATGMEVFIHPSSVIGDPLPEYVIFNQMVRTSKQYIREICVIDKDWLGELAADYFRSKLATLQDQQDDAPKTPSTPSKKQKNKFIIERNP